MERKILDSGSRTQFKSGAVRDMREGKGRCDLLPLDVVSRILCNDETLRYISEFTKTGSVDFLYGAIDADDKFMFDDGCTMILEVAKHFEEGAKKYGEFNWQKGIPAHCYVDSAVRHYLKHCRGDQDEPHDRAFMWNLMCCIWTCENKPELNDYATGVEDDELKQDKVNPSATIRVEAIEEFKEKYKDHIKNFTGRLTDEIGFVVNLDAILYAVDFVADNLKKETVGGAE